MRDISSGCAAGGGSVGRESELADDADVCVTSAVAVLQVAVLQDEKANLQTMLLFA